MCICLALIENVKMEMTLVTAWTLNNMLSLGKAVLAAPSNKALTTSKLQAFCEKKRRRKQRMSGVLDMKSEGLTMSSLLLSYADNGLLPEAQAVWYEMLNSSLIPSVQLIAQLFDAYGNMGCFDEITEIVDQLSSRNLSFLPEVYSLAISCFGKRGKLQFMENTINKMVSRGFVLDSVVGNEYIRYFSLFGSLGEMESAYHSLKRSRHLIEEEGIKAMSLAYIKKRKFYELGEFLRDVGLLRKNVGNLIWNLLLLSYAANFKMKSLQREFISMLKAGFRPDITTFNIRAIAFSKMSLFWDLHLSLEHMRFEKVVPDLVTYDCVVEAYMDKRLAKSLGFALSKMNLDDAPVVLTDPFVFEVLGKGQFLSSSEAFFEFKTQQQWTYGELINVYLKKQYRRDQIFWNY